MALTIGDLYTRYIWENNYPVEDLQYFYNKIYKTPHKLLKDIQNISFPPYNNDNLEKLKNILKNYHKRLGLLTDKVKENINNLDNGVVIAGQQATIFGGLSLIANKIAATVNIADCTNEQENRFVPVFLINTHDSIQPEITTIHLPNSKSSVSVPISFNNIKDGKAAHLLPTNDYSWLYKNLKKIANILNEFRYLLPKDKQQLYLERIEHLITFLQETYRSASTFDEWIILIYGIQADIINDWGLVFFPTRLPEIRELLVEGYYPILRRREEYISEFNKATDKIEKMGLRATTRRKKDDYSPFFYDCNNGYRVPLSCKKENNKLVFYGNCPETEEEVIFSTSLNDIDLSEVAIRLSARLDSNQATFQSIMPVIIRVSGPGEINYNAQVIPATRKIRQPFPIYVKYSRAIFNANWIEEIGKSSPVAPFALLSKEFFKMLGQISKAKRKGYEEETFELSRSIRKYILAKLEAIHDVTTNATDSIAMYKSWQWGITDTNKLWQESNYPWFFFASVTGLKDYLAAYRRQYNRFTPFDGLNFINSSV